jgi:hypothetical protein
VPSEEGSRELLTNLSSHDRILKKIIDSKTQKQSYDMKSMLKKTVMVLIMSISGMAASARAQADSTVNEQGPTGYGFFQPDFQFVTDVAKSERFFIRNYSQAFKGNLKYLRPDIAPDVPPAAILATVRKAILDKDPNLTDKQIANLFLTSVSFRTWSPEIWNKWGSYYFQPHPGQGTTLETWDPRTSTVFAGKTLYITAELCLPNGKRVPFKVDCGNLMARYPDEHFPPSTPPQNGPGPVSSNNCLIKFTAQYYQVKKGQEIWLHWTVTNCNCDHVNLSGFPSNLPLSYTQYVRVDSSTTFLLTTSCGQNASLPIRVMDNGPYLPYQPAPVVNTSTWFGRNAAWVVPVGIVAIGGTAYLLCHHASQHDNVYSNGFQGGSGASGATGGSGSQQQWSQQQQNTALHLPPGIFSVGAMTTPQGKHGVGFNLALHF